MAVVLASAGAHAAARWVRILGAPFRVYSDAGEQNARAVFSQLEEFRTTFSMATGVQDPKLVWPLAVVAVRHEGDAGPALPSPTLGRDALLVTVPAKGPLPPALYEQLARMLVDQNLKPLPVEEDAGLVAMLTGYSSESVHVTIHPPEAAGRTRDWGRIYHLFANPDTREQLGAYLYNLMQGADRDTAYRNAFRRSGKDMEAEIDFFLHSAIFPDIVFSGRPLSPIRDYQMATLEQDDASLLLADLMLARGDTGAQAAYSQLDGVTAEEGRGLAALGARDLATARREFAAAMRNNSPNARIYYEAALLDGATPRAREEFIEATRMNPRWAAPLLGLANLETAPAEKVKWLEKAAAITPRDAALWRKLAETAMLAQQYAIADRAWAGAMRATPDPAARQRLEVAREQMASARADAEEQKRKREEAAKTADLERVKQQTMAEIHAAEQEADRAMNPGGEKLTMQPVPYASLESNTKKTSGTLSEVVCKGKAMTLVVRGDDGTVSRLPVDDPSALTSPDGTPLLSCGPVNPPRRIAAEVRPGKRPQVLTVEFP
jgi:hypothetical protein